MPLEWKIKSYGDCTKALKFGVAYNFYAELFWTAGLLYILSINIEAWFLWSNGFKSNGNALKTAVKNV